MIRHSAPLCSLQLVVPRYFFVENGFGSLSRLHLDAQVEVSRSVIDQYGIMEWGVTFTMNPGVTPPGAGDVTMLSVIQNLTGIQDHASQPVMTETQKGSTGLAGKFSLDYNDAGGARCGSQ